jgi:hypothetical protein
MKALASEFCSAIRNALTLRPVEETEVLDR